MSYLNPQCCDFNTWSSGKPVQTYTLYAFIVGCHFCWLKMAPQRDAVLYLNVSFITIASIFDLIHVIDPQNLNWRHIGKRKKTFNAYIHLQSFLYLYFYFTTCGRLVLSRQWPAVTLHLSSLACRRSRCPDTPSSVMYGDERRLRLSAERCPLFSLFSFFVFFPGWSLVCFDHGFFVSNWMVPLATYTLLFSETKQIATKANLKLKCHKQFIYFIEKLQQKHIVVAQYISTIV